MDVIWTSFINGIWNPVRKALCRDDLLCRTAVPGATGSGSSRFPALGVQPPLARVGFKGDGAGLGRGRVRGAGLRGTTSRAVWLTANPDFGKLLACLRVSRSVSSSSECDWGWVIASCDCDRVGTGYDEGSAAVGSKGPSMLIS